MSAEAFAGLVILAKLSGKNGTGFPLNKAYEMVADEAKVEGWDWPNGTTVDLLFKGFNTKFNEFRGQVKTHWMAVAMKASSQGSDEVYGWLSALPQIREWLGDGVLSQMRKSD